MPGRVTAGMRMVPPWASMAERGCIRIFAIRVTTARAAWIVPPHRAVWIPGGTASALRTIGLQLPLPMDERAVRFAKAGGERVDVTPPLTELTRRSGASVRTLGRLFREETGLSLGQWLRRQLVLQALAMLGAEQSVNEIAAELGYSGASAFIAMLRRELGQSPARYLQEGEGR